MGGMFTNGRRRVGNEGGTASRAVPASRPGPAAAAIDPAVSAADREHVELLAAALAVAVVEDTAEVVLAWVGNDPIRAGWAAAAEQRRTDEPRRGMLTALAAVAQRGGR